MGTKLQFRKAQITKKTRRKLYCDYLNNLNHQKLNEWLSLRSAQKSLVYFRTKKREFLNNALIVQTKSSHIEGEGENHNEKVLSFVHFYGKVGWASKSVVFSVKCRCISKLDLLFAIIMANRRSSFKMQQYFCVRVFLSLISLLTNVTVLSQILPYTKNEQRKSALLPLSFMRIRSLYSFRTK